MEKRAYMVGIGGIGMSALAQYLKHAGHIVSGEDRDESPTVSLLREKGVDVFVPGGVLPDDAGLVIYSDAVPESHPVRIQAHARGIMQRSYFEALGEVSKKARTIAVAGTHGKTTTTAMLAKILERAHKNPTALIGSIVRDFGSNFVVGVPNLFVVEACEYRDHLLKLSPEILVITNIELDHTDYFPNLESLQHTFRTAVARVPKHGVIVTNPYDPVIAGALDRAQAPILDYTTVKVPELALIGEFNRANAKAAKAASKAAFPDLLEEGIDVALSDFKGAWRRFEYRGETPKGALVYDDYAHHPTAILKTIEAARKKFPDRRIVVAFHPHLYSRTKSFLNEFADALAHADFAVVAPIYAAREEPDPRVTHDVLADLAAERGGDVVALDSFDEIRHRLLQEDETSLIITMGAGDIYKVAEQIAD